MTSLTYQRRPLFVDALWKEGGRAGSRLQQTRWEPCIHSRVCSRSSATMVSPIKYAFIKLTSLTCLNTKRLVLSYDKAKFWPRHSWPRLSWLRHSGPRYSGLRYSGPRRSWPRYSGPRYSGPRHSWLRHSWPRHSLGSINRSVLWIFHKEELRICKHPIYNSFE